MRASCIRLLVFLVLWGWPVAWAASGLRLITTGERQFREGQYAEAVRSYKRALEKPLNDDWKGVAYHRLGQSYVKLNDPQHALESFEEVTSLLPSSSPDHHEALKWIGILHLRERDVSGAEDLFMKLLRLAPDDPNGHYFLGEIALFEGDKSAALAHFERAASLTQRDPYVLLNMGRAYDRLGMPHSALAALKKGLGFCQRTPGLYKVETVEAHLALGWVYYRCGYIDSAVDEWQDALGESSENRDARQNLAWYHNERALAAYARGKTADAVREWRSALEMDPKNKVAKYYLGRLQ